MFERVYQRRRSVTPLPVLLFFPSQTQFSRSMLIHDRRDPRETLSPLTVSTGNFTAYGLDWSTRSIRLVEIGRRPIRLSAGRFHRNRRILPPLPKSINRAIPVPLDLTLFYSVSPFVRHAFVSRLEDTIIDSDNT